MGLNMPGVYVKELIRGMYCGVMARLTRVGNVGLSHFSSKYKKLWYAPIGHGATRKELIMWIASGHPIR